MKIKDNLKAFLFLLVNEVGNVIFLPFFWMIYMLDAFYHLQQARMISSTNLTAISKHAHPVLSPHPLGCLRESQRLIIESLAEFSKNPNLANFAAALHSLQQAGILNQDHFEAVAERASPQNFSDILACLHRAGILTTKNCIAIGKHLDPFHFMWALDCLEEAKILTQDNFNVFARHPDPLKYARAILLLQEAGIFDQENFNTLGKHENPLQCVLVIVLLQEAGIFSAANRAAIAGYINPFDLTGVLVILEAGRILSPETRAVTAEHPNPKSVVDAIYSLQRVQMLTPENFTAIVAHEYPANSVEGLIILQRAGMLTAGNRKIIAQHKYPANFGPAFSHLVGVGILTQENLMMIAFNHDPVISAHALVLLHEEGMLTQDNRNVFAQHSALRNFFDAIISLEQASILTQKNFTAFAEHRDPRNFADALGYLSRELTLTQGDFNLLASHENLSIFNQVCFSLDLAGILTRASLTSLLMPQHAILLSIEVSQQLWGEMPIHLLTQNNFARLLTAAAGPNPRQAIDRVIDEIIPSAVFNGAQSTHTESVHKSVSESAQRLLASYADALNIETEIRKIKAFVSRLHHSSAQPEEDDVLKKDELLGLKYKAAKTCIETITDPYCTFTDPNSAVSLHQLLALAYIAIHDRVKCAATLKDAKKLFIEGLYEIQRGDNINHLGIDNNDPKDVSICLPGAFNKIIEKLNGIHSDVQVFYITKAGASAKFQKLAQQQGLSYLKGLASPQNAEEYKEVRKLLDALHKDGYAVIWGQIKDAVQEELWDEFKAAYYCNQSDIEFQRLIANGIYVETPDLAGIEKKLKESSGYNSFLEELCSGVSLILSANQNRGGAYESPRLKP